MVFSLSDHLRVTRCAQLSRDQTPNKPHQTPTTTYQTPTKPLPDLCQTLAPGVAPRVPPGSRLLIPWDTPAGLRERFQALVGQGTDMVW